MRTLCTAARPLTPRALTPYTHTLRHMHYRKRPSNPNPHTRQLCHRREPGQGGRKPPGWLLQAAHRRVHGGLAHICFDERGRSHPMLTHQHRRQVARRHPQRPWQSPQTAARHRARVTRRRALVLSAGREGETDGDDGEAMSNRSFEAAGISNYVLPMSYSGARWV